MIGIIAKRELTETIRDGRFRAAAAVVLLLLLAALALGIAQAREAGRERAAARAAERAAWLDQGARNPHSAAHFGQYAFKPTQALGWVDRGIDGYLGVAIWMEAHSQNPFRFRPAEDRLDLGRFGELTAALVLRLLVPLLIFLLAFAAFAGERELGQLHFALASGTKGWVLAAGKAAGLGAALGLVLLPGALIGAFALLLAAGGEADRLPRALLLALGYLLYFATLLALALAVSALAANARIALLVLLGFWIAGTLLGPRLATDLAERWVETPSASELKERIQQDLRAGLSGHDSEDVRFEALKKRVLAQYKVARIEDLPVNFDGIALQAGEEYGNRVFDRHYGALWDGFLRQDRVRAVAALASPALAIADWSMSMCGTDLTHYRHFAQAAEAHRRRIVRQLNGDMTRNAGAAGFDYLAAEKLWRKVPELDHRPFPVADAVRAAWPRLALLMGWMLGAAGFAFWASTRLLGREVRS